VVRVGEQAASFASLVMQSQPTIVIPFVQIRLGMGKDEQVIRAAAFLLLDLGQVLEQDGSLQQAAVACGKVMDWPRAIEEIQHEVAQVLGTLHAGWIMALQVSEGGNLWGRFLRNQRWLNTALLDKVLTGRIASRFRVL
jgi:hypothetical protein